MAFGKRAAAAPPTANPAAAYFGYLEDVFVSAEGWQTPGINHPAIALHSPFLDLILALDTCASYRRHMGDFKHPWLQCVISCLIGTFGGTTVAMLTLGVNPGWMGNIGSPVAFAMGFWMIFLCPGDIFYKLLTRNRSIELLFGYINTFSCGHAITSWGQDQAVNAFHLSHTAGSAPLAIWCGTIAGCGGGIVANALSASGKTPEWIFGTPVVLKGPSITVKTAFLSSCLYYLIRNPHGWFSYGTDAFVSHTQAKTIIWLVWVTVLTLHEIFKIPDPTMPLTNLVGKICLCDGLIGGQPDKGIYEKIMGDGGMTGEDSALSGFGFVKKIPGAGEASNGSGKPPTKTNAAKPAAKEQSNAKQQSDGGLFGLFGGAPAAPAAKKSQ